MIEFRIEPPEFLQDAALQAILRALPAARLVGGAVRDAVAARPVADIDLATPDTPEKIVQALDVAGLKHAPTGLQHGTVTAISGGRGFEVTTLRRDEITDGRHASVAWTEDWVQDAARRDFTFNAMSMRPDGLVFDYFNGAADLRAGRVRFVGDPAARIGEDYLRVLRFFRFYGRYAAGPVDPATAEALRHGAAQLGRLSAERVWSELKRILVTPNPVLAFRLMGDLGVLAAALPGALDLPAFERLTEAGAPPDPMLRLAALRPDAPVIERLKMSKAEVSQMQAFAGPPPDPDWDDDALRRALAETPAAVLEGRSWLADGASGARLRDRLHAAERPAFPLHGRDVVRLGIAAGPRVGVLLQGVRDWWMRGGCRATADECRAELARLARD